MRRTLPKKIKGSKESQSKRKRLEKTFSSGCEANGFNLENVGSNSITINGDVNVLAARHQASTATTDVENSTNVSGRTEGSHGSARDSKCQQHVFLIDVWMDTENAEIIPIFCRNNKSLKRVQERFKDDYKRLNNSPREIFAESGGTLRFKLTPEIPPEIIYTPQKDELLLDELEFRKSTHEMSFVLVHLPEKFGQGDECQMSYQTISLNSTKGQIEAPEGNLNFRWPIENNASTRLTVKDDDRSNETCGEPESTASGTSILVRAITEVQQKIGENRIKVQVIGTDEQSVKLGQCSITIQPGSVCGKKEVTISLTDKHEFVPKSVIPISQTLDKSTGFEKPISIKLISCFVPKPGMTFAVKIFVRSAGAAWKQVQLATFKDGKAIKYKTSASCSHIAVISAEDEKKGLYHLFCDAWVHRASGRILCLFFKFESSLTAANEALEGEYKRIMVLPGEVFVGIGSIIKMEIQSVSHPDLKIINDDGSNGRLQIDHKIRDESLFGLMFRPSHTLSAIQERKCYRFVCCANVLDEVDNPIDGGFKARIQFFWPQIPHQQFNTKKCEPERTTFKKKNSSTFDKEKYAIREDKPGENQVPDIASTLVVTGKETKWEPTEAKLKLESQSDSDKEMPLQKYPEDAEFKSTNTGKEAKWEPTEAELKLWGLYSVKLERQSDSDKDMPLEKYPGDAEFKSTKTGKETKWEPTEAEMKAFGLFSQSLLEIFPEDAEFKSTKIDCSPDQSSQPNVRITNTGMGPSTSSIGSSGAEHQRTINDVFTALLGEMEIPKRTKQIVLDAIQEKDRSKTSQQAIEQSPIRVGTEGARAAEFHILKEEIVEKMEDMKLGDSIEKLLMEAFEALIRQDDSEKSTMMLVTKFKEESDGLSPLFYENHKNLEEPFTEFWEDFLLKLAADTFERHLVDNTKTIRALAYICAKLSRQVLQRKEKSRKTESELKLSASRENDFINMGKDFASNHKPIHAILSFYKEAELHKLANNGDRSTDGIDTCSYKTCEVVEEMAKQETMRMLIIDHVISIMREMKDFIGSTLNSTRSLRVKYEAFCLYRIGLGYDYCGEYDQVAKENETAIQLLETEFKENANDYEIYGHCLNNAGVAHERMGNSIKATELFKRSLEAKKNTKDWISDEYENESIVTTRKNLRISEEKLKKGN